MTQLPTVSRTSSAIPKHASILIYGKAKLGKTTIVAETVEDLQPGEKPQNTLILATEDGETQGLQSIQDLDMPFVEIRDWQTFELVHAELTRVPGIAQYQGVQYENIINDSYSCNGNLWMEDALSKLGWKEIGLGRGRAGLQPYSYVAEKGRQTTKKLMMLNANHNANIIVVAREGIAETGMGTEDHKQWPCIELPGAKLFNELPGSFDAVIRLVSINNKRLFQVKEYEGAIAGLRVPKGFGDYPMYVTPNIRYIIRAIQGDKTVLPLLTPRKEDTTAQTQVVRLKR